MSTIAEFITGTVNESLKKLVQPVGLIPAAIFVLLNLAAVYPDARDGGVALAETFDSLDTVTQAAVVGLITLALGYFLLSASSIVLDILGGQLIRGSVVHALFVWLQRKKRDHLLKIDSSPNHWYVARRYYLPHDDEPARDPLPSALGNVLVATQGTVERRYGIDLAALWSQFAATPEIKELPARAVVEDERASRDTLANIAFALWVFALEGLVYFTFRDEPEQALLSLIALPAGYVVYRFAVAKAHAWGTAVETLFDLHRDKLHAALKLAPFSDLESERDVWERARGFYVGSGGRTEGDEVFKRDAAPSVTAIPAGDLTIPEPAAALVEQPLRQDEAIWLRWVEHVVLVAKKSRAGGAQDAHVLVEDPRVERIESVVGAGLPSHRVVRGSGGNDQLLWTLSELAPGGAVPLVYKLPLFTLAYSPAVTDPPLPELLPGVGFAVEVPAGAGLHVAAFAAGERRPEVRVGDELRAPAATDGWTYEWTGLGGQSIWLLLPGATSS